MNKDLRARLKGHETGEACRPGAGGGFIFLRLVKGGEGAGSQGPYQVRPAWNALLRLEEHVRIFHGTNEVSMHVLCMSSAPRCSSD